MTVILRNYSRYAAGTIEILLGAFLAFESALPFIKNFNEITGKPISGELEDFLSGTGISTSGFWIRMFAMLIGLLMILVPILPDSSRRLKIRSALSFIAFLLFIYVGVLTLIFTDITTFFWITPFTAGIMSALLFLGNSAEVRNYAAGNR